MPVVKTPGIKTHRLRAEPQALVRMSRHGGATAHNNPVPPVVGLAPRGSAVSASAIVWHPHLLRSLQHTESVPTHPPRCRIVAGRDSDSVPSGGPTTASTWLYLPTSRCPRGIRPRDGWVSKHPARDSRVSPRCCRRPPAVGQRSSARGGRASPECLHVR